MQNSVWAEVLNGVPQGSVFSPLLFVIYINDFPDMMKSKIELLSDDPQ